MKILWTPSYCGIMHVSNCPTGWQITIQLIDDSADAVMFALLSPHPFTPVRQFSGSLEAVKAEAEKWMQSLQ